MDEATWQRHAQTAATEILLAHVYNVTMRLAAAKEQDITAVEKGVLEAELLLPLPKAPPDISQHFAAEVQMELARLFEIARDQRQAAE